MSGRFRAQKVVVSKRTKMDGLSGQSCCEGRGQRAFEGQGRGNTALEPFAFSLRLICMWSVRDGTIYCSGAVTDNHSSTCINEHKHIFSLTYTHTHRRGDGFLWNAADRT